MSKTCYSNFRWTLIGAKVFSKLYLNKGFHKLELDEDSQHILVQQDFADLI